MRVLFIDNISWLLTDVFHGVLCGFRDNVTHRNSFYHSDKLTLPLFLSSQRGIQDVHVESDQGGHTLHLVSGAFKPLTGREEDAE